MLAIGLMMDLGHTELSAASTHPPPPPPAGGAHPLAPTVASREQTRPQARGRGRACAAVPTVFRLFRPKPLWLLTLELPVLQRHIEE